MSNEESTGSVFTNPVTWLVTNVIAPLFASASTAYCFWVVWEKLEKCKPEAIYMVMTPVILSMLSLILFRKRALLRTAALTAFPAIGYLIFFFFRFDEIIPKETPAWMLAREMHLLINCSAIMPMIVGGLWRIATVKTHFNRIADTLTTLVITVIAVPTGIFLSITAMSAVSRWLITDHINVAWLTVPVLMVFPIIFFIGIFRLLMHIRQISDHFISRILWLPMAFTIIIALVLPICGLLLNITIPFPADYQNLWVYVLTILNGAILLAPLNNRLGYFLRSATFPFTLYFFVVFLPFLPLSLLAIMAIGMGFLMLSPLLLFWHHIGLLAKDWKHYPKSIPCVAMLILPALLAVSIEYDRAKLRDILDYTFAQNVTADAKLPASPAQIKRILVRAYAAKNASDIPFLSAWYNQRVFDGMILPDGRIEKMWDLYVGAPVPEQKPNLWSSQFRASPGRRTSWNWSVSPPRNTSIGDSKVSIATANSEQTITLFVKITAPTSEQQEFYAPVTLPTATWVKGMKLKISGKWEPASIIEKRAAEWVYQQITTVQRRDPAIFSLASAEKGLLRVYPVTSKEPRELEITLIRPDCVGEGIVEIGGQKFVIPADKPIANIPFYSPINTDSATKIVLVDCSRSQTNAALQELIAKIETEKPDYVIAVNAETKTTKVENGKVTSDMLLPFRYGLDEDRALKQVNAFHWGDKKEIKLIGAWTEPDFVLSAFNVDCVQSNSDWRNGVEAWKKYYHYEFTGQKQDELFISQKYGILTPVGSYIVVEDDAQRKMLQVKQLQAKNAHSAMEFSETYPPVQSDAPYGIVLILGFGVFYYMRNRKVSTNFEN
ncbi:MAG: MSEP-CTERM sorting domain-containing protein [Kiritimatiellales bacterium]